MKEGHRSMVRVYIFPKIIVLTFLVSYILKISYWPYIILVLPLTTIAVLLYEVSYLWLKGKYYLYLRKKGHAPSEKKVFEYVNKVIRTVNYVQRISVKTEFKEYFDPEKTYLITPNHQSNSDITILLEIFTTPVIFVSKSSMSKVPLVKDWMNLINSIFIDRHDIRGQIRVMNKVLDKINQNKSVVLFPEGTRSLTFKMNKFKSGSFKTAPKTHIDILPLTINNAYKIKNRFPFKSTDVTVYIHKPLTYEEYKDMSTQELAATVQNIIETKIFPD